MRTLKTQATSNKKGGLVQGGCR